jgi:N-acetylmuramoyl-L-alanine amidase
MKKFCCSLLAVFSVSFLTSFHLPPADPGPKKPVISTIIIDAGHGGSDRGAKGAYSYEKDICLAIALKLGKKLEQELPNVKVLYTRTKDVYPSIRERADFANANKGDLFVSIHVNAAPKIKHSKFVGYKTVYYYTGKGKNRKKVAKKVKDYRTWYTTNPSKGTETYIWASDRADEKGDFVSERIHEEVSTGENVPDLNDPEFKARALLWTKRFFDKSLQLATYVEQEFVKEGRPSRGVKQRNEMGIWVLQATAMPSILVETGFITNKAEEDYLNSKKGQEEVANNIAAAIKRYKNASESAVTVARK